ncbi:phage tail protein [Pseudomonas sp. P155]|uniref:Phage tail protein n=1 Tax=Pseudomonas neuropathica TaxID=2730425 RepID=A0ABS0BKZ4_9PSED|nr:phage tail protein [Pseudomonas neuropathica]MBF6034008.1 phage tail protein [Pseudomonas neuropathica]
MPSFALVTEGITDQVVIERIIYTVIESTLGEEADINVLQPLRDATDVARQARDSFGGWEKVLEFCSNNEKLTEALEYNEFLVIQIDTDCCAHENFNVPYFKDGTELSAEQLASDVEKFIGSKLTEDFLDKFGHRVIFAIAVHSTECWLIPFYTGLKRDKSKLKSCETHLKKALAKSDIRHEKTFQCYNSLSNCFNKNRDINDAKAFSRTLEIFIDSLTSKTAHLNN